MAAKTLDGGYDVGVEADRVLAYLHVEDGPEDDSRGQSPATLPGLQSDHFRIWVKWSETLREALSR